MEGARSSSHDAERGAETIFRGFVTYQTAFSEITRRAPRRFATQDWSRRRDDALERLDLYSRVMADTVVALRAAMGDRIKDRSVWTAIRAAYSRKIEKRVDRELTETFFNSATRQVFATVGVDPTIEYVDLHPSAGPNADPSTDCLTFPNRRDTARLIADVLRHIELDAPFAHVDRDARAVAERIDAAYGTPGAWSAAEFIRAPFYRNQGCYLVGRLLLGDQVRPVVLALTSRPAGVMVDAVLLAEPDVSVVFSFTRSYFHVDLESPRGVIAFLRSLLPRKPVAELYTTLGYNKHGKTEFYRDMMRQVGHSRETFRPADGERGMVMIVFSMPSYDFVFKVIRDRFAYPKTVTRRDVTERYRLVFRHDRAGRLVEALEFEHMTFPRQLFSDTLLTELVEQAAESVRVRGDSVAVGHLYVERKVRPLNLYMREADDDAATAAVLDYGAAIADLASTNIFPGDLLPKNFGVTRHGRVVFYDYDELCLLTDCRFREMPVARDDQEEMASEPWFFVGPHDVFPEEFLNFLGLRGSHLRTFTSEHGGLLQPKFWRDLQNRHNAGELVEFFPYPVTQRIRA